MSENHNTPELHGLMVEFDNADALVHAIHKAKEAGYTKLDAFTPYAVGDVIDALDFPKSEMGAIMFMGGLIGACTGLFMQWYLNGVEYPLNVGGKPYFSWPSFVPVTFEMMVLTASLSGVFGLIALCGLPRPNHPVFNVPGFERASRDRFFMLVLSKDPKFDTHATKDFLHSLQPLQVAEVPE